MSAAQPRFKLKKPRLIHFVIAVLLALLIMDRGAAWLYGPKPGSKDVILYTTTWCPYCESLRAYLKGYNIPYIERDVEKTLAGTLGWWGLGHGRGVPLSVIGEQVVYGYDLVKITAALRAAGYSVQGPGDTAENYLPPPSLGESAASPRLTAAGSCAPAEDFDAFYEAFKADRGFQIQRTKFPLRKRVLSGSKPYLTTDEAVEVEKSEVESGQELVYLDREIIETGGYTVRIEKQVPGEAEIITSPEGAEPLTIHRFHNVSGCWYLVELVSYEYFGSMMILSSL
ncbi:MAG TPA: glutaredoxin domain-containing protein [Gammaproteobacteria bacterium]|nr:glutaredoxin domain-containing protein [Gammaproteobacteria bacterium]